MIPIHDPEDPTAMIETDEELDWRYRHGGCVLFAQALCLELGYSMRALFALSVVEDDGLSVENDDDCLAHAFAVRPDGTLVDVGGTFELDWLLHECNLDPIDGGSVWTSDVETEERVQALLRVSDYTAHPDELSALRAHIRVHPAVYGPPVPAPTPLAQ